VLKYDIAFSPASFVTPYIVVGNIGTSFFTSSKPDCSENTAIELGQNMDFTEVPIEAFTTFKKAPILISQVFIGYLSPLAESTAAKL
jgi:hypothetical protein